MLSGNVDVMSVYLGMAGRVVLLWTHVTVSQLRGSLCGCDWH